MKSLRFPLFSCRALAVGLVAGYCNPLVFADSAYWDATGADWGTAANWSTANNAVTPNPTTPPGANDEARFSISTLGTTTTSRSVNLLVNQSALKVVTVGQGFEIVLQSGGGGPVTLNIGASGIAHGAGALTIGSNTDPQQAVNIVLSGRDVNGVHEWNSTGAGNAARVMYVHNNVTTGLAGTTTLRLTGSNVGSGDQGALINGTVSDGAGPLGITKTGIGNWAINGATSYTGPTIVNQGRLNINAGKLHGPGLFTVASAGTLAIKAGGATEFTSDRVNTLVATGTFATGSNLRIENSGPIFSSVGTGDYHLTKSGAAELALAGISSRTGTTAISAGILRIRDLQSGGVPSSIGSSSSDANNFRFGSNTRLIYDGPATTSDRLINLAGTVTIEAAGSGPLQLTNTGSHPGNTGARNIFLIGSNRDDNHIAGMLGVNTRTDSAIIKRGNGSWRISGTQPVMTGSTTYRIDEGKLTFDYSTGNDPFSPVTLLLNGGETILKGNGTATADTITTLNLGSVQISQYQLRLRNGFALTANTMTANQAQRNDLIDLYDPVGNPNNTLTVNALGGTLGVTNDLLMVNSTTSAARANTVLRAQDGTYGFPVLSSGTSGTIQKAANYTVLSTGPISMADATAHYRLNAGEYSASANLSFSTVQFNSDDGPVELDLGARKMIAGAFGKAMLFSGDNDITITGNFDHNSAGEDTALWFHNYLPDTAKVKLEVGLGDKPQTVIFGGTGTTEYSGRGFVGTFDVNGGKFRYTTDQFVDINYTTSPTFKIGSGAILEIGARLVDTDVHPADFIKPVGNQTDYNVTPNVVTASGTVRLLGDAGLSAYTANPGGKRVVCFSTVFSDPFTNPDPILTTQQLIWGTNYFLTISESEGSVDGDNTFMLSSDTSNATLEIQNNINLNGRSRTIEVANGSANIDAQLSGSLTGDGATGIVKRGAGTLQLSGVNAYKGETRVMEGTLMIDGATLDEQSRLWIDSGATLHIDPASINANAVHVSSVFIDGVQYFGTITHPRIVGGGTLISDAALTPYAQWVINKALGTAESAPTYDADFDGIRNLVEYAVGSEPKTPNGSVFAITGSAPRQIKFNHPSGRTDIGIYLEASPTLAAPWTTIATSTVGAAFVSNDANVTVTEISNQVTVTDSRTPAATVMFYRLRVEK